MVHAVAITTALTSEEVAERIGSYVKRNVAPLIAAERVIADLCREGRQSELLDLLGPPALFDLWESTRRTKPTPPPTSASEIGRRRRIDRDALMRAGSILESLYQIDGGRWVRVGDMGQQECRRAAATQKKRALDVAKRARFFHALARQLPEAATVRDVFNEAALAALFAEAGV